MKQKQIENFYLFVEKTKVLQVLKTLTDSGFEAYIAGGAVRDMLLGKSPVDFDLASNAKPKDIKRLFPKNNPKGERFGTIEAVIDSEAFEITTYRSEDVYSDSRHPDFIKFAETYLEDSSRRDFTINAMYVDQDGRVFDPQGGLADLQGKLIRTVGRAEERFQEDALRVLRAFRFASQLGFSLEKKAQRFAIENWSQLSEVSAERIYNEFRKMVMGKYFHSVLPLFFEHNLFEYWVGPIGLLIQSDDIDFLTQRLKYNVHSISRFENFILDYSLLNLNSNERMQNQWLSYLPFRRIEKNRISDAGYFFSYLKKQSLNLSHNGKDKNDRAVQDDIIPDVWMGKALRLGLNAWTLSDLKGYLTKDLLNRFGFNDEDSVNILSCLQRLALTPESPLRAKDLMDAGVRQGPELRKKLELALDIFIVRPECSKEELLSLTMAHALD